MIIEIGTCDFDTKAGIEDGLFVEPVKYYFDKLPECRKENVAVSNFCGMIDIFYLPEDEIISRNLPDWLKGCSSVNNPHPTVLTVLKNYGCPESLIVKESVPVVTIESLIEKYEITKIETLKIDTEGHDCVILNDYLDTVSITPNEIIFEYNALSVKEEIDEVVKRLESLGYQMSYSHQNCIAERQIKC